VGAGNNRRPCGSRYFDDDGNRVPVFEAFHKFARPPHRTDGQ
jgi:hypothetical protein